MCKDPGASPCGSSEAQRERAGVFTLRPSWVSSYGLLLRRVLALALARDDQHVALVEIDRVVSPAAVDGVVGVTLTTAKGGPVLSAPKIKGSRRTVKLSQTALQALRSHLERQLGEIDRAGDLWRENGLIFASEVGEPLDRHYTTKHRFNPLLKRAGLPEIRFHDLRHTCVTLLLSKNVNPKIVSEMLGHATIAITLDTYSHVLPTMQESAAKAMEDALS